MNRFTTLLILSLFLTFFSAANVPAQTVHLVRIADVHGEGIGSSVQNDARNVLHAMKQNIPKNKLIDHEFDWKHRNKREDVLNFLRTLPNVKTADTVVFYYSGHGMHDQERGQYYPLAFPKTEHNDLLKQEVITAIETHHPRLTVIISDCCSVVSNQRPAAKGGGNVKPKGIGIQPLFQELFFEAKGLVDFQAAQIDEAALAFTGEDGSSLMTNILCGLLEKHRNERLDWKTFFSHIQRETAAASMEVEKAEAKAQGKAPGDGNVLHHTPKAYALGLVFGAAAAEVVMNGKKYVKVAQLRKDYPAERGGLEVNDILLDINGRGIRSKEDYFNAIDGTSRTLEVKILRRNEVLVKKIELY